MIKDITDRFQSSVSGSFIGIQVTRSIVSNPTEADIINGYNADNQTITVTVSIRTKTYLLVSGKRAGLISNVLGTDTLTIDVPEDLVPKVEFLLDIEQRSQALQKEVERLKAAEAGARLLFQPYFTDEETSTNFSLSNSRLNTYYSAATAGDPDTEAVILIDNNSGVQNALTAIETGIARAAAPAIADFNAAIADATSLSTSTGGLNTQITALQVALGDLATTLDAGVDVNEQWDEWVRLERLQVVRDVRFTAEKLSLTEVSDLWTAIPVAADFDSATDFTALNTPDWDDALALFNDPRFVRIVTAYKQAEDLAKSFTNFKTATYTDFRAVYRNILRFETARTYLESAFDFEAFKSDYRDNVDQLNTVANSLDLIVLKAQLDGTAGIAASGSGAGHRCRESQHGRGRVLRLAQKRCPDPV